MTRTITSNAPGSGTSISSSWKASAGWPSRSWRITHAAIVSGSVPGSVSTLATFVTSIAICSQILLSQDRAAEIRRLLRAERFRYSLGLDVLGAVPLASGEAAALDQEPGRHHAHDND